MPTSLHRFASSQGLYPCRCPGFPTCCFQLYFIMHLCDLLTSEPPAQRQVFSWVHKSWESLGQPGQLWTLLTPGVNLKRQRTEPQWPANGAC